jgi:8-oxo-dGTP diphosphatase
MRSQILIDAIAVGWTDALAAIRICRERQQYRMGHGFKFNLKRPANGDTTDQGKGRSSTDTMANPTATFRTYPDAPRPAVGAVVFKGDAVLLVLRGNSPSRGAWAIPGGSVRLGETLQAAAEREIFEETGVVIRAGDPILVFDAIEKDERGEVKYHYVIVDLAADYVSGVPRAGDDAADARWIEEDALAQLPVNPATRRLLAEKFNFGK